MSSPFPLEAPVSALLDADLLRFFTEPGLPFSRLSEGRVHGGLRSRPGPLAVVLLLMLCLCCACAGTPSLPADCTSTAHRSTIYVVNHGWHTGLILRRRDVPEGLWPEKADFPEADFLELGWGDWDYYQADVPGVGLTLKAALWPTASVLHVVGVKGAVADRFGGFELIPLDLPDERFNDLVAYVDRSYARDRGAKTSPIGPGWSGDSLFYPARGRFHLFNTCNGWTSGALEAAGFPMGLLRPITAGQVIARVRRFGGTCVAAKSSAAQTAGDQDAGGRRRRLPVDGILRPAG